MRLLHSRIRILSCQLDLPNRMPEIRLIQHQREPLIDDIHLPRGG